MCGRFALIVDASVLADVFDVDPPRELQPRFNIAPTQTIPIIRAGKEASRECSMVRWGLVPSWAKDEKIGARMINARGETVAEKPSFRSAVKSRRCLIPADGFYEWVRTGDGKQPIHPFRRRQTLCLCRALGAVEQRRGRAPRYVHDHHHITNDAHRRNSTIACR